MSLTVSDDSFFATTMASTPDTKPAKEHVVKRNEGLWEIARKELGNKAKRGDVLKYMYQIGKLNNKKTIDDLNNLKENEIIYLPAVPDTKSSSAKVANSRNSQSLNSRTVQSTNTRNTQSVNSRKVPVSGPIKPTKAQSISKASSIRISRPKTNAELGFDDFKNAIMNNDMSSLLVECGYSQYKISNYTIYKKDPANPYVNKKLGSFTMDENNNLICVNFNGQKDENSIYYDFEVNKNGKINRASNIGFYQKTSECVDKQNMAQLETRLKELTKNKGFIK